MARTNYSGNSDDAISSNTRITTFATGSELGNGNIDGYLRLIAAVAKQAKESNCQCDSCANWIQLYTDWCQ